MTFAKRSFGAVFRRALFSILAAGFFLTATPHLVQAQAPAPAPAAPAPAAPAIPTAASLFSLTNGADAPIQWVENIILGTNAPDPETFLPPNGNENSSGTVQAGLTAVLSTYSYAMLVLASFLLLYYLLKMVAETAHTGKAGGRANQLWGPIRSVLAIGLLIPLPSGLNSGQMIILNIVSEGSALGTNAWNAFVGAFTNNSILVQPNAPDEEQMVYNAFLTYVCENAYNYQIAVGQNGQPGPIATDYLVGPTLSQPPAGSTTETIAFGNGTNNALCGTISYEVAPTVTTADTAVISDIINGQASALQTMMTTVQAQACTFVQQMYPGNGWASCPNPYANTGASAPGKSTITNATLQADVAAYQANLNAAIQSGYVAANSAIKAQLTTDNTLGWLGVGPFYLTIARMQQLIVTSNQHQPTIPGPESMQQISFTGRVYSQALVNQREGDTIDFQDMQQAINDATSLVLNGTDTPGTPPDPTGTAPTTVPANAATLSAAITQGTLAGTTSAGVGTDLGSFIENITKKAFSLFGVGGSMLIGTPLSGFPITALQKLGWDCIALGVGIYGMGVVGGLFSSGISSLAVLLGSTLFAPGILLAYVLPVLPFLRLIMAVFGWLLSIVEAIVEIPMFAIAHLNPEGEGVLPEVTKNGYRLLLGIFVRPILIVTGFVLSILLMNGLFDFLNLVWMPVVLGANGDVVFMNNGTNITSGSDIGIFSDIVYGIIYAAFSYSICNACFKVMDFIPNQALRWIGGHGDQHDSHHGSDVAAATMAGAQMIRGASQVGQGFVNDFKKLTGSDPGKVGAQRHQEMMDALKHRNGTGEAMDTNPGVTDGGSNSLSDKPHTLDSISNQANRQVAPANGLPGAPALPPRAAPPNPSRGKA